MHCIHKSFMKMYRWTSWTLEKKNNLINISWMKSYFFNTYCWTFFSFSSSRSIRSYLEETLFEMKYANHFTFWSLYTDHTLQNKWAVFIINIWWKLNGLYRWSWWSSTKREQHDVLNRLQYLKSMYFYLPGWPFVPDVPFDYV